MNQVYKLDGSTSAHAALNECNIGVTFIMLLIHLDNTIQLQGI